MADVTILDPEKEEEKTEYDVHIIPSDPLSPEDQLNALQRISEKRTDEKHPQTKITGKKTTFRPKEVQTKRKPVNSIQDIPSLDSFRQQVQERRTREKEEQNVLVENKVDQYFRWGSRILIVGVGVLAMYGLYSFFKTSSTSQILGPAEVELSPPIEINRNMFTNPKFSDTYVSNI